MGWRTGWYSSKQGMPAVLFSKSLAWPANSRWCRNILEAMTDELQYEFPDWSFEFKLPLNILFPEHVIRLILLLDTHWWMKSSNILDNGYWTV
jgi:hypothetical protein